MRHSVIGCEQILESHAVTSVLLANRIDAGKSCCNKCHLTIGEALEIYVHNTCVTL